jgi:hypothetical protein
VALVLLIAVLATGVGLALGGHPRGLARLRLRLPVLLVLAAAVQVIGILLPEPATPLRWAALTATALLTGGFVLANLAVPGVALIGLGLALNTLVIGLNGGMPVRPTSAEHAGVDWALAVGDPLHVSGVGARLGWLGDVVPVLNPLHREVVSVGDLLVAAGVGLLVVTALTAHRPQAQKRLERSTIRDSESTTFGS